MLRPWENGLPSAASGNEPSLLPVHSDGEQLPAEIKTRDRLCCATQSAEATPLTSPAYSHQPLPGALTPKIPRMRLPSLQVVTKLSGPATLYLLLCRPSIMPLTVTTPAI